MAFQSSLEGEALPPNHPLNADARHAGAAGYQYVMSHDFRIVVQTTKVTVHQHRGVHYA